MMVMVEKKPLIRVRLRAASPHLEALLDLESRAESLPVHHGEGDYGPQPCEVGASLRLHRLPALVRQLHEGEDVVVVVLLAYVYM